MEGGRELRVGVLGEVGTDLGGGSGVLCVPEEGLVVGIGGGGVVGKAGEESAAFGSGAGGVGEDAAKGDLIAGVCGVALDEGAETSDGVGATVFRGGLGLIVGEGPLAGWGFGAEELAVDLHGLLVLAGGGVLACLGELGVLGLEVRAGLDAGDVGIAGIDGAEAIEIGVGECGVAVEFGGAGETGEGFGVVGVGEEDLLPGLGGEVEAATGFE